MNKIAKRILIGLGGLVGVTLVAAGGFLLYLHLKFGEVGYNQKWSDDLGMAYRDIHYGEGEANTYDLFIPKHSQRRDSVAVMLFVHGGSWTGGDKKEMEFECCNAAKNGYLSATMNYHVAADDSPASMMGMLDEIQQCIAHVKQKTETLGYHVSQMSIGGISAGGHLSMLYAYSRREQSPLPIAFVIDQVGPVDLRVIFQVPEEYADIDEIHNLVRMVSGKDFPKGMTKQTVDSVLLAASPIAYVDSLSAPTLMAYGANDGIVHKPHSEKLTAAFKKSSLAYKFFWFPNSNHALYGDPDQTEKFHQAITEYSKHYFGY